jgi:hypothetical protein
MTCPRCGSECGFTGALGFLQAWRCRVCGTVWRRFHTEAAGVRR